MRRPRSTAHTTVLWTCVMGCLWIAMTDDKVTQDALPHPAASEVQAAEADRPGSRVGPVPARAFLGTTPAPVDEDLAP